MEAFKNKLRKYGLLPKPKWMAVGFAFMGLFPAFTFMLVSLLLPEYIIMYNAAFLFRGISSGEIWAFAMGGLALHYFNQHVREKEKLKHEDSNMANPTH